MPDTLLHPRVNDHCVISYDISSDETNEYVGKCSSSGLTLSGHRTIEVRIEEPIGIAAHGNLVFLTLYAAKKVMQIDITTDQAKEFMETEHYLLQLHVDLARSLLYFGFSDGVGVMDMDNEMEATILAGSQEAGKQVGSFNETRFGGVGAMLACDGSFFLVNDNTNER